MGLSARSGIYTVEDWLTLQAAKGDINRWQELESLYRKVPEVSHKSLQHVWIKLQEASLIEPLEPTLEWYRKTPAYELHDKDCNIAFKTLCAIGNHGQGDTTISPHSAIEYDIWMVLALYEITLITSRCWCIYCRHLFTVIRSKSDPKVLASILQDVVSITEDKNLDPVLYGDWLSQVGSCFRSILNHLSLSAIGKCPTESMKFDWMGYLVRAQNRLLTK